MPPSSSREYSRDDGASFVEYAVLILFISIILVAIFSSGVASHVSNGFQSAIDNVFSIQGSEGEDSSSDGVVEGDGNEGLGEGFDSSGAEETNDESIDSEGELDKSTNSEEGESGNEGSSGIPHVETNEYGDPEFFTADLNDPAYFYDSGAPLGQGVSSEGGRGNDDPGPGEFDSSEAGQGVFGPTTGDERSIPPDPPIWDKSDEGSGEWDSQWAFPDDYIMRDLAMAGALWKMGDWPEASKNLRWYLENGGQPLEQDVDVMLEDMSGFSDFASEQEASLFADAIDQAQALEIEEPTTFSISGPWVGYTYAEQSLYGIDDRWFYALGEFDISISGAVTVYPPEEKDGEWRYEADTAVDLRDMYNWDGNKSTIIDLPFFGETEITDEQLSELHRSGLAQEFVAHGRSAARENEGVA